MKSLDFSSRSQGRSHAGFTLVELCVAVALSGLLLFILPLALARSQPTSKTFQCQNNTRQLYSAWRQWTDDHNGFLVTCQDSSASSQRPNWISGTLNWDGANPSNYDYHTDLANPNPTKSPLWTYVAGSLAVFKCPADVSTVTLANSWNGLPAGTVVPRVRSISMSGVFGTGEWLDGGLNPGQTKWRVYRKTGDIVLPFKTFVFIDEQPDSINDAMLNVQCTGAQPGDPPASAKIIDFPASFHNGAASLSFADGHALSHQWIGNTIRVPFQPGTFFNLNVSAGDSWIDVQWLAQNTTVKY
jgi:prepilin-type N-terminal cleavage/methylation domain-containing protein/prepilin-type processing-associated H-X9-DG protein